MSKGKTVFQILALFIVIMVIIVSTRKDTVTEEMSVQEDISANVVSSLENNQITQETNTMEQETIMVTMITSQGNIEIELWKDKAPKTVENFITLAQNGFYDGTRFHRVIEGFMIQGGDPLSKDTAQMARWGTGGPGYQFADEIHAENKNITGTISMANAGPNTNGSQFFINVADNSYLDTRHTVFGKVVSGYDVVETISLVDTIPGADRPIQDVVIQSIEIK
jgi:cyclophilin family peptidyl-prolyl cis-trans isomerase